MARGGDEGRRRGEPAGTRPGDDGARERVSVRGALLAVEPVARVRRPRGRVGRRGCDRPSPRAPDPEYPMRFGIFFELSVPRPGTAESERTVYENALEQARVADELGFDWVWAVEH